MLTSNGLELEQFSGVTLTAAKGQARWRNPERSEGPHYLKGWCHRKDSNLSRLAGVSAAGARWRNPECSEGPHYLKSWCHRRDSNPHTVAGTWT